ncbi:MAG: sodium:solute symporter family protein [Verrucomicrobiales bacterium]
MPALPLALTAVQWWTFGIVAVTFLLYIGIAVWSRASSTGEFYVAGKGVSPVVNGMATAADWMSAASFISMAGLISFMGRDGAVYLMGWTGGYVLLALLLAPYLRKFGKFTVPEFIGDRYYSKTARLVAVICAIFVSFTYVAGQMQGVGIVFARIFRVEPTTGVMIGMVVVFVYAVMGGMKGITYTQVAQYCVLIFAYLVPAIFISILLTDNPVPQLGLGSKLAGSDSYLLDRLDGLTQELGFGQYTGRSRNIGDVFCIAMALMVGTAGLPHVIVRFYTVKKVKDARASAFWALVFIGILYTTAAAVAAFGFTNLLKEVPGKPYAEMPGWFKTYEDLGLMKWEDKNGDGLIQYYGSKIEDPAKVNELTVNKDIMVLANPEIANLPNWVIGLVAAGCLAAALSTAAGLLLVISTSVSHDLLKRTLLPHISEREELRYARIAAAGAIGLAAILGIKPPGFVGEVVAFAFGLAASSFFPAIILGIFWKRMNMQGAISGMVVGILFTMIYIIHFQFGFELIGIKQGVKDDYLFGISPQGIGTLGMILNFVVAVAVSLFTAPPPKRSKKWSRASGCRRTPISAPIVRRDEKSAFNRPPN